MCYIGSNRLQQLNIIHNYSLFPMDELFGLGFFIGVFRYIDREKKLVQK